MSPDQQCFDNYQVSNPNKLLLKEKTKIDSFYGTRVVTEVFADGPGNQKYYLNIYCLQEREYAIVITFYEKAEGEINKNTDLYKRILSTLDIRDQD